MKNLIKRKQKLEQELVLYQERYQSLESEEKENVSKSTKLVEELNNERLNFEQLKATRKNYKNAFLQLKIEIGLYKENKIAEVRKFYVEKYNNFLKRISQLDFRLSYKIFGTFENARVIYDEIEFENLKKDFYEFINTKRNDLKQKTLDSLSIKLYDRKKIHEALFYLRFLVKYELFFGENIMTDFFYGITQNEFEYHFLSNKETNRLDKPEWIFEFLLDQFTKYSKIFRSYEEIFVVERMAHNKTLDKTTGKPLFEQYITKSNTLLSLKINEIANFESKQKRKLILNFGIHLVNFIQKIEKAFNFYLKIDEFSQVIDEIQSNYFYERLEDVHSRRYVEWFEIYEDITREVMVYVCNFRSLNIDFKLINLIDNILEYNSVFVCSMRYIQREEIRALCYLYNKFENFKGFLIDTENELIQEKINKNEEKDNLIVLDDEKEMINILNKITEFNLENLKLIKSLLENDLQNLFSILRRFRYSAETISRNFMIETGRIFEDYKECDAYRILHKLASSLTDKFLLEEILISQKFNVNEFLDFNYFFTKLKRFYDIDAWESQEALNCIKDILEDRRREGPLFEIINELYNDGKNF